MSIAADKAADAFVHATIDLHAGLSLNPLLLPDEASKLAFEPPHVIYFHSFEGRRVASTRMSGIAICDCASGSGRLFPRADCTLRSRVYVTYCTRNRCRQDGTKRQLNSLQVCARRRELGLLGLTSMIWPHAAQADSGGSWLSTSAIISAAFTAAVVALGALTLGVVYLTASTWNDSRIEKEDRQKFDKAFDERGGYPDEPQPGKRRPLASKGPSRGFGKR